MPADHVLQRTRDEEILLHETQLFAFVLLVIRVKHLRNRFAVGFLPHRFAVAAFVEGLEVELLLGMGRPEAK